MIEHSTEMRPTSCDYDKYIAIEEYKHCINFHPPIIMMWNWINVFVWTANRLDKVFYTDRWVDFTGLEIKTGSVREGEFCFAAVSLYWQRFDNDLIRNSPIFSTIYFSFIWFQGPKVCNAPPDDTKTAKNLKIWSSRTRTHDL